MTGSSTGQQHRTDLPRKKFNGGKKKMTLHMYICMHDTTRTHVLGTGESRSQMSTSTANGQRVYLRSPHGRHARRDGLVVVRAQNRNTRARLSTILTAYFPNTHFGQLATTTVSSVLPQSLLQHRLASLTTPAMPRQELWNARSVHSRSRAKSFSTAGQAGRCLRLTRQKRTFSLPHDTKRCGKTNQWRTAREREKKKNKRKRKRNFQALPKYIYHQNACQYEHQNTSLPFRSEEDTRGRRVLIGAKLTRSGTRRCGR